MTWRQNAARFLAAIALATVATPSALAAPPSQQQIETLVEAFTKLVDGHYSKPDAEALLDAALQGMLDALGDPHTDYMSPEEFERFVESINGAYAGIGVVFAPNPDQSLRITTVYPGAPADQAGLKPGDVVEAVDGIPVAELSEEAPARIRGEAGTTVTLTVRSGDAEPRTVRLERAEVELPTVAEQDLGDGLSYVRITTFADRTAEEFNAALARVEARDARGLVIDLRGNGGGYVIAALEIADRLLSGGGIIQITNTGGEYERLDADPEWSRIPVAVLVDGHTASAAEMLAGALQKNGRAKVIGQQTYGKGSMQMPLELPNGGFLKLSVDEWLLPDGTPVDHLGLTPDIQVDRISLALNVAGQQLLPGRLQSITYRGSSPGVLLNGLELPETAPRVLRTDGMIYIPLRYTVEGFGNEVQWSAADGLVTFTLNGRKVRIHPVTGKLWAEGLELPLPNAVRIESGMTYLSLEAFYTLTGTLPEVAGDSVTIFSR